MFGSIRVPAILENVVGECADGVEVSVGIRRFCGRAWKDKTGSYYEDDEHIHSNSHRSSQHHRLLLGSVLTQHFDNREDKACLNETAILRLLDHEPVENY